MRRRGVFRALALCVGWCLGTGSTLAQTTWLAGPAGSAMSVADALVKALDGDTIELLSGEYGGGLVIVHFANGAFHYSLPEAAASDWPEFRKICRRVWDHTSNSTHDDFGKFQVKMGPVTHKITEGLPPFETTDELYFNQKGEDPIEPILTATSKKTGKDEALAWTYNYGKGRVFQTLLGHSIESFQAPTYKVILHRGAAWAAKGL